MRKDTVRPWFTITLTFSWRRTLATLCFGLAGLILVYGFILRPMLSTFVGRQVSQRISEQVADEIAQAAIAGLLSSPVALTGSGAATGQPDGGAGGSPDANSVEAAPMPVLQGELSQSAAAARPGQPTAEALAGAVVAQIQSAGQPPAGAQARPAGQPPAGAQARLAGRPPAGAAPTAAAGGAVGAPAPTAQAPSGAMATPVVATPISAPLSERSVQEIVAALPPGEITVSEEKLNAKIAPRVPSMAPIERIAVRFVPGEVRVTLAVFGQENVATAGLALDGNRVVVRDPRLSGPLAMVISAADLIRPIEEELNNTLEVADRQVRSVRIEQGQIVVTLD